MESEESLAFWCCCCLRQSPSGSSEAALIGCHTSGLKEVIQTLPDPPMNCLFLQISSRALSG